jgi:hypothetical protein
MDGGTNGDMTDSDAHVSFIPMTSTKLMSLLGLGSLPLLIFFWSLLLVLYKPIGALPLSS